MSLHPGKAVIVFSVPSKPSPSRIPLRHSKNTKSLSLLSKSMCFSLSSTASSPQRLSDFLDLTRYQSRKVVPCPITPLQRRILPEFSPCKPHKKTRILLRQSPVKVRRKIRSFTEVADFDLAPWSRSSTHAESPEP